MSISVASRKQKARLLQQLVVRAVLEKFPSLTSRDVKSVPMGVTGADVELSEAAVKLYPYSIEAKSTESLSIWKALEQAQSETRDKDLTPLLVFKRNRSDVYCALRFEDFMKLIKGEENE